ncbi:MAG: hypothetical protein PVJ57_10995 [Phycisphaerae bacterium]|jgi:hypothetical protein
METNTAEHKSQAVLTKEELDAALAEIEELVPGQDGMPSLDDGQGGHVVPIPVPTPGMPARPAAAPAPGAAQPAPAPEQAVTAETKAETSDGTAATGDDADRPSLVFRLLDTALKAINRPFGWLSPGVRGIVGLVAMVTIITSLVAGLLLPRLAAEQDVVSLLRAKRAELLVAPPQPPAEAPAPDE